MKLKLINVIIILVCFSAISYAFDKPYFIFDRSNKLNNQNLNLTIEDIYNKITNFTNMGATITYNNSFFSYPTYTSSSNTYYNTYDSVGLTNEIANRKSADAYIALSTGAIQLQLDALQTLVYEIRKSTGVTQIIAGSNITISPSNGIGAVTINSTGAGETNYVIYDSGYVLYENERVIYP